MTRNSFSVLLLARQIFTQGKVTARFFSTHLLWPSIHSITNPVLLWTTATKKGKMISSRPKALWFVIERRPEYVSISFLMTPGHIITKFKGKSPGVIKKVRNGFIHGAEKLCIEKKKVMTAPILLAA